MIGQETLQDLWRFNDDDLRANQQGRLSDRQFQAQTDELELMIRLSLIAVAVVFSICLIIILIVGEPILIPAVLVFAAFFVRIILRHRQHTLSDLKTGEVQVVQGQVRLERKITRSPGQKKASGASYKTASYYLHVGERTFIIRSEVYSELHNKIPGEMLVYYLARSKRIVAAEFA